MARLEDLTRGAQVKGVRNDGPVEVVDVKWFGRGAIELTFKDGQGKRGNELLYRTDEPRLEIAAKGPAWNFDADGHLFRLVSEAYRIRLAYLFDPLLAVHTSLVEPLPHQILAVYGEMLPRQPLRFLLADDPGAGKTIMAGLQMKELIDRGHVFIAMAPLYRIKKGRSEQYIFDEREFQKRLMAAATDEQSVKLSNGRVLEGADLAKFMVQLMEYIQYLDKLERRVGDPRVASALAACDLAKKEDFRTKTKLSKLAKDLEKIGAKAEFAFDEEHSLHELVLKNGLAGETRINWELASLAEYKRASELAAKLEAQDKPPFTVSSNGSKVKKESARELLEFLVEQGKKHLSITRFKGLGEMNAEELGDTTMNPEKRTLLQVKLEDTVQADEIFTTLMGEGVEARRKFIEDNALDVKNLDI